MRIERTSSSVCPATTQKGFSVSRRRRNCRKTDVRTRENFFERDDGPAVRCHQAQADLSSMGRSCQIIRHFFQKGQVCEVQILGIVNDETLGPDISHCLNQPGAPNPPGQGRKQAKFGRNRHSQRAIFSPILGRTNCQHRPVPGSWWLSRVGIFMPPPEKPKEQPWWSVASVACVLAWPQARLQEEIVPKAMVLL